MRIPLPFPCRAALCACLALALCACAAPVLKKDVLRPAQASDVARLTRLTVAPFDNDPDGSVRAAVESALSSIQVNGRPYFTLVGPGSPPAASLGVPMQWVDPAKPKDKAIRYGSEGTVRASVNQNGWRDESYYVQRRECWSEDAKGRCRSWGFRNVRCVNRFANFSFTPRVVAKDSGEVLMSQEFAQTEQSSACLDENDPSPGVSLLAKARGKVLDRFRQHVAPHTVTVGIPLITEDGSGMSAAVEATVKQGLEYAKAGRADEACRHWRAAARAHPAGFALPYLQGVCEELEDDLDAAQEFYTQADRRSPKPLQEIAAALSRIARTRADLEKLDRQLR